MAPPPLALAAQPSRPAPNPVVPLPERGTEWARLRLLALSPRPGRGRDALSMLGSVALHGAVFAGILVLLPEVLRPPDREHGVEMVWQDEGVDSAAAASAPASIPAPPAPDPAAPPPQAVAPPPRPAPPPSPAPSLPQQVARVAPPPAPPLAAPPAPPDRPVEVPLPPEAPPQQAPIRAEAPPQQASMPAEVPPSQASMPAEVPPSQAPVAEAPPAEPLQMADPIPMPPPPMPLPLMPLRTADARPVPVRPPAAPMRPMPGIAPLGQAADGDTQAERVGATRVVGATVPPGLLDGVRNAQPEYPSSSRLRGEQGVVALVLQVSTAGAVTGVEIGRTSGFAQLDEAAKKAALRWRFRPATRDGVAIEGTIRTQVHFRLVQ